MEHYKSLKSGEKRVTKMDAGHLGRGLVAGFNIRKGKKFLEYVDELVNDLEYQERFTQYMRNNYKNDYFAKLVEGLHIDATYVGNDCRYANHSCNPNAEFVSVLLENSNIWVLFLESIRYIPKNTPIKVDYGWFKDTIRKAIINVDDIVECKCGEVNCRKYI